MPTAGFNRLVCILNQAGAYLLLTGVYYSSLVGVKNREEFGNIWGINRGS